jgi:transposase
MRPHGNPEELERRRCRAIELLEQGHPPVEVARIVDVDRRSVRRWNAAYRKQGIGGLKRKPVPGRPSKLSPARHKRLEAVLLKGARAAGFPTDLWTCPRVAEVIQIRFGIRYHVDHVGRLLHSLGWSPQKPQRRAVERNEADIQRWVKTEWPRIKKKPRVTKRG